MYGRLYVTRITLQDFVLRADADHISGVLNCSTYVVLYVVLQHTHCKVFNSTYCRVLNLCGIVCGIVAHTL